MAGFWFSFLRFTASRHVWKLLTVLLITISAAIYLMILIIEIEDMRQLLLDGGDAAWVLAVDHVL